MIERQKKLAIFEIVNKVFFQRPKNLEKLDTNDKQ